MPSPLAISIHEQGREALSDLQKRWPELHQTLNASPPLWEDNLRAVDPSIASFALQVMGWLDMSSSALVSSNIALNKDRDPHSAYRELLQRLDQLLSEVSSQPPARKVLGGWNVLRKRDTRTPPERLQQFTLDKSELDKTGRGRLRGMREAMEMRELTRLAASALLDIMPAFKKEVDTLLAAKEVAIAQVDEGSLFQAQKTARDYRALQRAQSALVSIAERLSHELLSPQKNLDDLDEALHQEEMMHARIDGVMGKIASTLASGQVEQSAKARALQSTAITPSKPAPVPARSAGFLSAWMSQGTGHTRSSSKSAKTLRLLASGKTPEWADVLALVSDPNVGPSTSVGTSPLLETLIRLNPTTLGVNASDVSGLIVKLSDMDNGKTLFNAVNVATVERYCYSLLSKSSPSYYDDEDDLDDYSGDFTVDSSQHSTPGPSLFNLAQPETAMKLWRAAHLTSRRGAGSALWFALSLRQHAHPDWLSIVQEAACSQPEKFSDLMVAHSNIRDMVNEAIVMDRSATPSLVYVALMASLKSKEPSVPTILRDKLHLLTDIEASHLATQIFKSHRANKNWAGLMGSATPSPPPIEHDDNTWFNTTTFMIIDPPHVKKQFDTPPVVLLRQYHGMVFGGHSFERWPEGLLDKALERNNISLLHELIAAQPTAQPTDTPLGVCVGNPLAKVIHLDIFVDGKKGKKYWRSENVDASMTRPAYWCEVLKDWKDVGGSNKSKIVSDTNSTSLDMPRFTPLMLAASENAQAWIRALLDSGVDVDVRDSDNKTAMDHWVKGLSARQMNTAKGKPSPASFLQRAIREMDKMGWWGLESLSASCSIPTEKVFACVFVMHAGLDVSCPLTGNQEKLIQVLVSMLPDMNKKSLITHIAAHISAVGPSPDPSTIDRIVERLEEMGQAAGIQWGPKDETVDTLQASFTSKPEKTQQMKIKYQEKTAMEMKMMMEMQAKKYRV